MKLTNNFTLAEQLKRHEGTVKKNGYHFPYKCPADKRRRKGEKRKA